MTAVAFPSPIDQRVAFQIAERYDLKHRMAAAMHMLATADTKKLLRTHLDRSITAAEVPARDNLDELLAGLSVLYIAGFAVDGTIERLGLPGEGIVELLGHDDVRRYYEVHYPSALPALLRDTLSHTAAYTLSFYPERDDPKWPSVFRRFMLLDTVFNASGTMNDFLGILDGYRIHGVRFVDLQFALADPAMMRRWVEQPYRQDLLLGMDEFLSFSEELDRFLNSIEQLPMIRGLIWLNYAYWYGAGGERMRKMVGWVQSTLDKVETEQPVDLDDQCPRELGAVFERLTNASRYIEPLLSSSDGALERWLYHSTK